jgi:hypothetical protein
MIQLSAAAYFHHNRFNAVLIRSDGPDRICARLTVPCAAALDGSLRLLSEDLLQISELASHSFRLRTIMALGRVFPFGEFQYPTTGQISPHVKVSLKEHQTGEGSTKIATAVVAVDMIRENHVLVIAKSRLEELDMYPANWGHLLRHVRDSGYIPFDVESVLTFLRSISHDQAQTWIGKVSTFRDHPGEWAQLAMRELDESEPVKRISPPTRIQRGFQ